MKLAQDPQLNIQYIGTQGANILNFCKTHTTPHFLYSNATNAHKYASHKLLYIILSNYRLHAKRVNTLKNIIIIGYGFVAEHVAVLESAVKTQLSTLSRNREKQTKLQSQGIQTLIGDLDDNCDLSALPLPGSGVYYFAPPPNNGTKDTRIERFLSNLDMAVPPQCIVYISTTGVYSTQGPNINTDENSPTQPNLARGQRRLDAENKLLQWGEKNPKTRIVILRVVGIYGPNKLPLERIKRGEPLLDPSYPSFVNLIHIDDLAQACFQAMRLGKPSEKYNISDGKPLLMTEYFQAIAQAFNYPQPPLISMAEAEKQLSAGFLSYLKETRHIDNTKMLRELKIQLRHPDVRVAIEGIARKQANGKVSSELTPRLNK